MMKGNRRLALLALVATVTACAAGMLVNAADNACYNDVVVSGAGSALANGVYSFTMMSNGKPVYGAPGIGMYWDGASWSIGGLYSNSSDTPTPPSSGWTVDIGASPAPTLSGGEECADEDPAPVVITINPTGGGGPDSFLDVLLPLAEGEAAPMIGLHPLAAIHAVGDVVTGSCQILGAHGLPTGASYVHVYIYSVDAGVAPEVIVLLDHWTASYNRETREFEFAWDTEGLAPGYYDMYLSFQDGTAYTFRIHLI